MGSYLSLSPSSAARWVVCPASVALQAEYPRQPDSVALQEGIASHELAEKALKGYLRKGKIDFSFLEAQEVASNGYIITQEMKDAVKLYIEDIFKTHIGNNLVGSERNVEFFLACEKIHARCKGVIDFWASSEDFKKLVIWDFKYGHSPVSAYENWQLLCYAVSLCYAYQVNNDTIIELRIVQPRAYGKTLSVWSLQASSIGAYHEKLKKAADNVLSDSPTACVSEQCRYCRASHGCRALQEASLKATHTAKEYSTPNEINGVGLSYEIGYLKEAQDILKYRLDALEAEAKKQISEGRSVPGFCLEPTFSSLKWSKSIEEIKALAELFGIDSTRILKAPELITPTQAKKIPELKELIPSYASSEKTGMKLAKLNQNDIINKLGEKYDN